MGMSKKLQKKIRRADAQIKKAKLEIRKLKVDLKKGKKLQKRLESGLKNVTKVLRVRFGPRR